MESSFFIEIGSVQKSHVGERICGDVFISKKIKEENRTIVVLSDGMGHGVKANLLATLTATMAVNFTAEHKDVHKIAEIIMNTLPVCSERKISYSTFTIIDVEESGQTTIINYDNPECIILREEEFFDPTWHIIELSTNDTRPKDIQACTFKAQKEDRIVMMTDGITQSGLGKGKYLLGYGLDNARELILRKVKENNRISAARLAEALVNVAHTNDKYQSKDDISTVAVYFREPRQLLLCSGPPFDKKKDEYLINIVKEFSGKKILMGGTTADIIAKGLQLEIEDSLKFDDPDLPPLSFMEGMDIVSEGILTMSKAINILKTFNERTELGNGPADKIVDLLLRSDKIHLCIGTAINVAHQDPNLPVELEIRRSAAKKLALLLEENFLKEVKLEFI